VTEEYNQKWHDINVLSKVPIQLTSGAGIKNLALKVRDSFNVESANTYIDVVLDLDTPTSCGVEVASENVGVALVNFKMSGVDLLGPVQSNMKFSVSGDIAGIYLDVPFEDKEDFWIKIGTEEGIKNITIAVFDEAGNQCAVQNFSVNYDRNWAPFGIELINNGNYTNDPEVNVDIRVDAFDKSMYDILIEGMVVEDMG
jgi:hypothetical protein